MGHPALMHEAERIEQLHAVKSTYFGGQATLVRQKVEKLAFLVQFAGDVVDARLQPGLVLEDGVLLGAVHPSDVFVLHSSGLFNFVSNQFLAFVGSEKDLDRALRSACLRLLVGFPDLGGAALAQFFDESVVVDHTFLQVVLIKVVGLYYYRPILRILSDGPLSLFSW